MIFALVAASLAVAAPPKAEFDARIELLGVVQRLAGRAPAGRPAAYAAEVDRSFSACRNDPAVSLYAKLTRPGDDPLGTVALFVSSEPLFGGEGPWPLEGAFGGREALKGLLSALKGFSERCRFPAFFSSHQGLYRTWSDDDRKRRLPVDAEGAVAAYTGEPRALRQIVFLSTLYDPGGQYSNYIVPYPKSADAKGPFSVYVLQRPLGEKAGSPLFEPTVEWEELVFVSLEIDFARLGEGLFPRGRTNPIPGCPDLKRCAMGMIAKAVSRRLDAAAMGRAERKPAVTVEQKYVAAMARRLELEYEGGRQRYRTLSDFYPRLVELLGAPPA